MVDLDLFWKHASKTLFVTREQFFASLDGWRIDQIEDDQGVVMFTLSKGSEFHFASCDTGRPISRGMFRRAYDHIIKEYGFVETKTPRSMDRQHRFNLAYGFKRVGEDETCIHYRLVDRRALGPGPVRTSANIGPTQPLSRMP